MNFRKTSCLLLTILLLVSCAVEQPKKEVDSIVDEPTSEIIDKEDVQEELVTTPLVTSTTELVVEIQPYACFANNKTFEYYDDTKTICYFYTLDDEKLRTRELQKIMKKEMLLKDNESIIAKYDEEKLEVIIPNDIGTYDVVDTYTLTSKKDESYVPTNYYDKDKNALYFTLDNTKSKADNESDIFIFAMENRIIRDNAVNSWEVLLDDSIRNGAAILTFGKPVDGRYVAQYTMTLYTKGTYKGYNGVVYSGNNPTVQAPIDVCTVLDSSTLECPDGVWELEDVNGEMMIRIDTKAKEEAFDTSIRHNGYDRYYDYTTIRTVYGDGMVYFYTVHEGNYNQANIGTAWDKIASGELKSWEDFYNYLVENDISIFTRLNKEEGLVYYEEVLPIDKQLVQCAFYVHQFHTKEQVEICPDYVKKTVLKREFEE